MKNSSTSSVSTNLRVNLFLLLLGAIGLMSILLVNSEILENLFLKLNGVKYLPSSEFIIHFFFFLILLVSVYLGCQFSEKAGFKMYLIEAIVKNRAISISPFELFRTAILAALLSGVITLISYKIFEFLDKEQLIMLQNAGLSEFKNRLFARAFTEQIIIYYGFTTFFTWFFHKFLGRERKVSVWMAIITASLLSSIAQYFLVIEGIMGLSSFGIFLFFFVTKFVITTIYGWVYWKNGLETSIISRIILGMLIIVLH